MSGNPFVGLNEQLATWQKEAAQKASQKAVKVATAILTTLFEETPIDTGKLVSNWQVSLNAPITQPIEAHIVGKFGSEAEGNISIAAEAATQALSQKKPGDVIHIANYVPYVTYLNDGTDRVAAHSFVEKALLVGDSV